MQNDVITVAFATGGAGYGDPLERDPRAVGDDIDKGLVSEWAAEHVYHVAYDPERHRVDGPETERLRAGHGDDPVAVDQPGDLAGGDRCHRELPSRGSGPGTGYGGPGDLAADGGRAAQGNVGSAETGGQAHADPHGGLLLVLAA